MSFGNVETVAEKGDEKQNVSEMIVSRGFAAVVKHRTDEVRKRILASAHEKQVDSF